VTEAATGQHSKKSLDLVQLRELLGELCQRKDSDTLLDVVFGVLFQAEKVIEDQSVEIQQLRKQLFGRRSEKLSPDQLSLFAQMLATVTAPQVQVPSTPDGPATTPHKKKSGSPLHSATPSSSVNRARGCGGLRGRRALIRSSPWGLVTSSFNCSASIFSVVGHSAIAFLLVSTWGDARY
jgi:Transposase C of IS166 homeodomain